MKGLLRIAFDPSIPTDGLEEGAFGIGLVDVVDHLPDEGSRMPIASRRGGAGHALQFYGRPELEIDRNPASGRAIPILGITPIDSAIDLKQTHVVKV